METLFYGFIIEHSAMEQLEEAMEGYVAELREGTHYLFGDQPKLLRMLDQGESALKERLGNISLVRVVKLSSEEEYLQFLQESKLLSQEKHEQFLPEKKRGKTFVLIDLRKDSLILLSNETGESFEKILSDSKKGKGILKQILTLYEYVSGEIAVFDRVIDVSI